jgi:hypothetical protein
MGATLMSGKNRTYTSLFLTTFIIVFASVFFILVFIKLLPNLINLVTGGSGSPIFYLLFMAFSILVGLFKRYSTEEKLEALSKAHGSDSAEAVLNTCRATKSPYAVYLRSFSLEKHSTPLITQIIGGKIQPLPAREVEANLLAQIGGLMPVLALSDPSDPFPTPGFYRFRRLGRYWVDFLGSLLKDASLIIIYQGDSPGLMTEISLIHDMQLGDKTLFISSKPKFAAEALSGHLARIFGPAFAQQQIFGMQEKPGQADRSFLSSALVITFASLLAMSISLKLFLPVALRESSLRADFRSEEREKVRLNQKSGNFTTFEILERRRVASTMERYFISQGYAVRASLTGLRSDVLELKFSTVLIHQQDKIIINNLFLKWLKDSGFTRVDVEGQDFNHVYDLEPL